MPILILLIILILISVATFIFSLVLFSRSKSSDDNALIYKFDDFDKKLSDNKQELQCQFDLSRKSDAEIQSTARKEIQSTLFDFQKNLSDVLSNFRDFVTGRLDFLTKSTQEGMDLQKTAIQESIRSIQESNEKKLEQVRLTVDEKLQATQRNLVDFQTAVGAKFDSLVKSTNDTLNGQKEGLQRSLKDIEVANEKKLEQMRLTVDEKLQSTLEKRLNASFELVGRQLESVQKGLGEMQSLASDVGGLKRALTNVKTAGGMGEVQLESLISDFLSPEQYEKNAHPNPSNQRKVVEFAVKIPAKEDRRGFIYLPIDSKYPAEVWNKLTLAYEAGDKEEIENQRRALKVDVRTFAKDIRDKYIELPYTTEFGVMFIPFEGLYSEILRNSELCQTIQNEFKVVIMGPSTLNAFLNSLRVGFRTLAIEKKTSEVWKVLAQVKSDFGKFGDIFAKAKSKLDAVAKEIENAEHRSRQIEKKLDKVEALPEAEKPLSLDLTSDET